MEKGLSAFVFWVALSALKNPAAWQFIHTLFLSTKSTGAYSWLLEWDKADAFDSRM